MLWARKAKRARPFDDYFTVRSVYLPDPGLNKDLLWYVPDDWYCLLTHVQYQLSTGVGIGNRFANLQVTRNNVIWRPVMTNYALGPNGSINYHFSIGVTYVRPSATIPHEFRALPHLLYLIPGDLLWLYTDGFQSGDRIHNGRLQILLWEI